MDVKRAAEALDTDPKRLRQFLRSDAKYKSPGAGGRYDLSGFSVDELREAYDLWAKVSTPRTARVEPETTDDADEHDESPPLPVGASRDEVRAHAAQRVARLEEKLRANGLHLSQLKDRASWARVSKPRTSR
jgi:hypothetical protein